MKKKLKAAFLTAAKLCGGFALARYLTRNGVVIIGWHGISIEDEHRRFPFYFISQPTLRKRIAFLKRHYTVISLDEAMEMHASGRIKPRCCVLTFDDGLYDFTAAGVPVMKEQNVTGTLYVLSAKMQNALAHKFAAKDIVLRAQEHRGGSSTVVEAQYRDTLADQQQKLADANEDHRYALLREFAKQFHVDFEPVIEKRIWNHHHPYELKELVDDGFGVQVHTHTHKTVVEHPDTVSEEAATCRELLEAATEKAATDFCYPSGLWEHAAWEPLRRAGMRGAVTCKTGPNFANTPALALRRYVDHNENSQLEFEAYASGFNWLLNVLFKPSRYSEPSIALDEGPPYF